MSFQEIANNDILLPLSLPRKHQYNDYSLVCIYMTDYKPIQTLANQNKMLARFKNL
jgi:hypothetical protein